jgi:hypothetical protein
MNPPDFARLKGRALLLIDFLRESASDASLRESGFQWPVEPISAMAMPGMLVNGTNALFWRQAVPRETLRAADRKIRWHSDSWAYITTVIIKGEEEDARQRLIYPGITEWHKVTSVHGNWEEAVGEVVINALLHGIPEPLLEKLRKVTKLPDRAD